MVREQFDYNVVKPDQSIIEIRRGPREVIGDFVWNDEEHKYDYLGILPITEREVEEILQSIKKLNKKSVLPQWLNWGYSRK
jgi:hypothetical protein